MTPCCLSVGLGQKSALANGIWAVVIQAEALNVACKVQVLSSASVVLSKKSMSQLATGERRTPGAALTQSQVQNQAQLTYN